MTYTLILLRHGESEWNALNLFTGWVDVDLSAKGEAEAKNGGKLMLDKGLLPDIVHTSLLTRAVVAGRAEERSQQERLHSINVDPVVDLPTALYLADPYVQEGTDFKVVGQFETAAAGEYFGMTFEKGSPLVACVDLALADLKDDGSLLMRTSRDRATLLASMERFASKTERDVHPHPIFGPLTTWEWQRWGWLHADHHLRQFGV